MSRTLAMHGGKPLIRTPIKPLNTVTTQDIMNIGNLMGGAYNGQTPLSGYLAGSERGGNWVQRLEYQWQNTFHVEHAIACNSCTSAILAAVALSRERHSYNRVVLPAMGMSAVAAVPTLLEMAVRFEDVDRWFCLNLAPDMVHETDIVIAVNLFGHPAYLRDLRQICDAKDAVLIEDNAQAPWAREDGTYTGTIGHIACWSMNVHKAINCGEGGMITTNDPTLARALRAFINHGETHNEVPAGLNLRMPEIIAALGIGQLHSGRDVVEHRREVRSSIMNQIAPKRLQIIPDRAGCESSVYCLPMLAPNQRARDWVCEALRCEGINTLAGYTLIPRMEAFTHYQANFPMADEYVSRLVLLELTSIDPTDEQCSQIAEALTSIDEAMQ